MPPAEPNMEPTPPPPPGLPVAYPARRRMPRYTRAVLVLMAVGFLGVFAVAGVIRPYDADGSPRTMATHTQLGLPPCNMVVLTGRPCPSCGMTTSFALLVRGDVANSLRANWAGTVLALFWAALIPWAALSAVRGRLLWVRNGELFVTVSVGVMLALMLGRWVVVLLTQ